MRGDDWWHQSVQRQRNIIDLSFPLELQAINILRSKCGFLRGPAGSLGVMAERRPIDCSNDRRKADN